MKIEAKVTNTVDQCGAVYVSSCESGEIAVSFGTADGKSVRRFLDPDRAVALWRCLTGETEKADVATTYAEAMHISYDDKTTLWKIVLKSDLVAILNADQAMALAWGIKKCVADVLDTTPKEKNKTDVKRISLLDVWVLQAQRLLTGDSAADGVEALGGDVKVYSSAEKARNDLREFLRPLVNEAYSETWWGNSGCNVDDVLDEVIDGEQRSYGESVWFHDGQTQSFQVTLSKKMVDAI